MFRLNQKSESNLANCGSVAHPLSSTLLAVSEPDWEEQQQMPLIHD
jgi:hypothetical protein